VGGLVVQLIKFCDEQAEQAESQFQLLNMHMQMKPNREGGTASYREELGHDDAARGATVRRASARFH